MKILIFFMLLAFFGFVNFVYAQAMENSNDLQTQPDFLQEAAVDDFFLEYREAGGKDTYKEGDKAGEVLRIYPSGMAELFNLIYAEGLNKTKYMEQFAARHLFSEQKVSEIRELIDENDMRQWPENLPDVSPLKAGFRTPAPSVRIFYKNQQSEEEINIKANLGADKKHYPNGFFRIYSLMRKLLHEVRN